MPKVEVKVDGGPLEQAVDEDISAFERWFCSVVDSSAPLLTGAERAIIKSYLWYKTHETAAEDSSTDGG